MNIIDTHCHLDFDVFSGDREAVLKRAREQHVNGFVIPGVQKNTWDKLIDMCNQSSDLHYALGLHPMFIQSHVSEHLLVLEEYIHSNQPVAVGEIGLDFHEKSLDKNIQAEFFEKQLQLASKVDLPVILHVRKAHEEVLSYIKKYSICGGIVHAFNGSQQQAQRYSENNFKFGFGGMLTFERSTKLRTLAKVLPIESIVLETDAPDMTVFQHKGERNSPEYLPYCLHALAEVKSMPVQEVADITTYNAQQVLNL